MVKSKFPGKPSKIIQRSLVRAYSVAVPSCDSSAVSEEVFLGLSVFDQTFGVQDEISSFKGFSSAEIDRSFAQKEEFVNQVREKFAQRGVSLSFSKRCVPSPVEIVSPSVNEPEFPALGCKRERRKCGKLWLLKKGSRFTKMPVRHNFKALNKNSLIRFKHKSSNYLSDKYCRKFVLPSRSVHSSRVIKPNKRFVDGDKNAKSKLLLKNFKTHKYETDAKSFGDDKAQGSANVIPSKVIIREARLNITTESAIAGPFSAKKAISFEKDKFKSGFITCGICGVVRHYKYILQTKKFGIYSCEPCRRFILKMIKLSKQSYCEILKCKAENGIGKCVIDSGVMCQQKLSNEESPTKSSRCQACWLMLCLQKYMMPGTLRKTLVKLIPEELKIFSTCVVSIDLAKRSFVYEPDNPIYRAKNESEDGNDTLKKRLRVNHFSKACSSGRRLLEKTDPTSTKSRPFLGRKSTSNHKSNVKNKWTVENSSREHNEKELQVPRGPRIKHVCRSASSVLRTSLASSNDLEEDDAEDRRVSAESEMNIAEYAENEDYKSEKYSSDDKCSSYGDNFENDECSSKKYGARTLQDFCKESHDKADDREDKLISIDFWEAYDPDEIFKIGFPLIGTESTNVRALCFLCGSAGQEKLLYCVSCCEAYHWYCAEGPSAFREEAELEKCRVNWVCRKCKVCSTCGERSADALISCQRCRCSYHPECLTNKALNKRLFNSDRHWVCPSCLKCKSCNVSSVFTFVGNVPLCSQCFKLRQKGNYCPLCQGCYEDEDYNVQMMECGVCKCWIHARCEGLSDEKYQILSFLPESIEFVCKLCCPVPPARWWSAVEDELKAGYLGILKKLCKNKQINELFKESPRKNAFCQCEPQFRAQSPRPCYADDSSPSSSPSADKPDADPTKRCLNFADETSEQGSGDEAVRADVDVAADDADGPDGLDKSAPPEKPIENTVKQCELCSSANELSTKVNESLLSVKSNVHNGCYASLSTFHNDLENAIAQIDEGRLLQTYRDILRTFFPWFDAENASCLNQADNTVEAPTNDASSGSEFEELINVSDDEHYEHLRRLMATDDYPYENFRMLDVRVCILCKAIGEAAPTEGGRLVYCGRNDWVHSNCALWSSEVFEEIDGSLQNVHSAITRGRRIRCSLCEKKGASVGCCYKNCGLTYHFACAKKAQCKFFHNKTIYCQGHDTPSEDPAFSLLANEKDFEILRPVYVETDRKKKRLECHANVKLRVGSLLVESLGKIDPHLSDHPKRIIPMQFRCTRLFWSTVKPWKIVQYCLQIKVHYSYDMRLSESESNYTVEHAPAEEIVQSVLEEVLRKVCASDECRLCEAISVNGHSDLLFPELQDTIYKDLPTDVLNDHTLHDIWNNYDNADNAETCATEEANADFDTDSEKNDLSDSKTSSLRRSRGVEKRHSKTKRSRMGECFNGKYLRDKNNVIRDSAKQNYIHNHWFKQLRGRVKRKMNFENSSQSARKRKYENYISPSKLDDALQYFTSYENILQLDGMVEIYNEEEPVKCVQCHRTYRTTLSFERHLETCNADFGDFMISSCESDSASSEEDKYCTGADFINVTNGENVLSAGPTNVDEYNITSHLQDDPFIAKYAANNACTATYILDNTDKMLPAQPFNGTTNLCTNVAFNGVYPSYTTAPYEETRLMDTGCGAVLQNNAISLQTLLQNAVKQEPVTTVVSSPSIALHTVEPATMKLNFVSNGNGLVASKACADYITTPQFAFSGANLPTQQYEIQNLAAPAYVIHQSYPKTDIIPTYVAVDNSAINEATTYISQPATTATLQLQQMPTASVNFQPMVPTILGTIVQPNICETPTYIVNTAAPPSTVPAQTFAAAAPQSNIILPSQPVIFGLETVVSNTIMSSSQFLTQSPTGNVGASTMYSTTTTQVFQAAKPMPQPDLSSSYIVLNPSSSVQSTPAILHTNVSQPTSVASAVIPTAKQLDPVVSCPSDVGTYMYVHLNQSPAPAANVVANAPTAKIERKKPSIIMKPVKQSPIQARKSIKIMKVKNNRPVGIEVKHISPSADIKPAVQLSSLCDEKAMKLQIKTTDKAIKLGQPATAAQPVPCYQLMELGSGTKNGLCHSACHKASIIAEKSLQINADQKTASQLAETTDIVTFKSEPASKDVNASDPPAHVPKTLSQISATDVKQEHVSPKVAGCSYFGISSISNQAESVPAKSEPLSTPQIGNYPKVESKELVTTQQAPSSKSTVASSSNKTLHSKPPSHDSIGDRRNTSVRTPSETERLFDELMRQHLEGEERRRQRLAEATAQSSTTTVSTDSSSTALPPQETMSPSMPLLDDVKPYEPQKMECQSSNEVFALSTAEPSSKNAPTKFTLLKGYKPRLQPRVAEEGSVANADKKPATASAMAAKKLNKSPEKENKEILMGNHEAAHKSWKTASISFEVSADDGFSYKTNDLLDLWNKILESVQQSRAKYKLPLLPKNATKDAESVYGLLGFENNASKYLMEQLPDAWKCIFYKPVFHKPPGKVGKTPLVENKSGCARSEPFASSHKYDMFGWLTSEHRDPPKFIMNLDSDIVNGNRRVTSPNLPMTMRFRNLKENAKKTVGVFRSDIHSRGLFCLRDIDAEEMVIEYAGEVIRSTLTDKREKYYTSKGIGCYMFRIDDRYVVDATMCGNAARFINHSCDPNCYSRIVDIHGKKHILIFALKRITKGVELTYDYKFPLEDEKIDCHCKSSKCRKYLN